MKGENFVYRYQGNLYVNLTNRCSNRCDFCVRHNGDGIGDSGNLWLDREPSAQEVIELIESAGEFNELIFCGYGEPTYCINVLYEVGKYVRGKNKKIRLNTNGQGNLINGYDITPLLCEVIDTVSVSLNSHSANEYDAICHSIFGEKAFDALLDFVKKCVALNIKVIMSVVDVDGVDIDACKKIASDCGVSLRVREYIAK